MKHVGLLLHFYQPPTQDTAVLKEIDRECYRPLFEMLADIGVGVTVNMNYSLTEQLKQHAPETLSIVSQLKGCCFSSSGAYHPIFPLIPPSETERQISLNNSGNRSLLGDIYRPTGVFPPEMALDMNTVKIMSSMGYKWTITDDIPWVHSYSKVPATWIPSVENTAVFLRSNFWSNLISFHSGSGFDMADRLIRDLYSWAGEGDSYVVLSMDGETFGHHIEGAIDSFLKPFLEQIAARDGIQISSMDTLLEEFPLRESIVPAGSWSTTAADLDAEQPFPLWNHTECSDHETYWRLLNFVLRECRNSSVPGVGDSVDKMLYSCPLWWASPGRESYLQVRRGILLIIEAALDGLSERALLDRVMELAGQIPAMARKDR